MTVLHDLVSRDYSRQDNAFIYRNYKGERKAPYYLWNILTVDGSETPHSLISQYTTVELTKKAIDNYLEEQETGKNK